MNKICIITGVVALATSVYAADTAPVVNSSKPNIILIYADDLGAGLLGFNGQKIIKTPHIDRLAAEGMRFTNAHGSAYCAPARARLITGLNCATEGAFRISQGGLVAKLDKEDITRKEFDEMLKKRSQPAREGEVFLAQIPKDAGYKTAQFGKLEFGFTTSHERLKRHGWEHYLGYMDHVRCHGFYPPYLWLNGKKLSFKDNLNPNAKKKPGDPKGTYSQLIFIEHILAFLDEHKDKPFFLYHPTQLPHGPVAIPEIHADFKDDDRLKEDEKKYASMVKMLDDHVGLIMERLKKNGMDKNTIVIFTSDNGHELYYAQKIKGKTHAKKAGRAWHGEGDVFLGNMGMASRKWGVYEGGLRVPFVVRWPGKIAPGSMSDLLIAEHDIMPTLAELVGVTMPAGKSGLSFLPTLLGETARQKKHDFLLFGSCGPAVIAGDFKLVGAGGKSKKPELFDLKKDPGERNNLAKSMPEKLKQLQAIWDKYGVKPRSDIPSE